MNPGSFYQSDVFENGFCGGSVFCKLLLESITCKIGVHPALGLQSFLPLGRFRQLFNIGTNGLFLLRCQAWRSGNHAPVLDNDVEAAFLQCRCIDTFKLLLAGNRQNANRTGLNLAFEFAIAGNTGCYLRAEDGSKSFTAAGVSDIVDLGWINARSLCNQTSRDVVCAAGRTATPGDAARIYLQLLDELADIFKRG